MDESEVRQRIWRICGWGFKAENKMWPRSRSRHAATESLPSATKRRLDRVPSDFLSVSSPSGVPGLFALEERMDPGPSVYIGLPNYIPVGIVLYKHLGVTMRCFHISLLVRVVTFRCSIKTSRASVLERTLNFERLRHPRALQHHAKGSELGF